MEERRKELCRWCGGDAVDGVARDGSGFWCADCDGFTYYDEAENEKHRMLLVIESEAREPLPKMGKDGLKKRLSPLRYPGGKSRLVGGILSSSQPWQMDRFVEVFAGGASVGLSLLEAGRTRELVLNDADPDVYAFWKTVLYAPEFLLGKMEETIPTRELFFQAKEKLKEDLAEEERAWYFFLVNRTAFSGIQMANPMGDITARWNPENLAGRIRNIAAMKERVTLCHMDACEFLEQYAYWTDSTTLFIDPPYYKKGSLLYPHAYGRDDHAALAEVANSLYTGFGGPDIIITYDDCPEIEELYPWADIQRVRRNYSCRKNR